MEISSSSEAGTSTTGRPPPPQLMVDYNSGAGGYSGSGGQRTSVESVEVGVGMEGDGFGQHGHSHHPFELELDLDLAASFASMRMHSHSHSAAGVGMQPGQPGQVMGVSGSGSASADYHPSYSHNQHQHLNNNNQHQHGSVRERSHSFAASSSASVGYYSSNQQPMRHHNSLSHAQSRARVGSQPHIGASSLTLNMNQSVLHHQMAVNSRRGSTAADKKSNLYKTEFCRSMEETGECRYGAKCQFAHSEAELRLVDRHPKYKTQMCKTFWENGHCPYGKRCCFIHAPNPSIGDSSLTDMPGSPTVPTTPTRSKSFSAASTSHGTPASAVSSPYGKLTHPSVTTFSLSPQLQQQQQQQQNQQNQQHQQQMFQQQLQNHPQQQHSPQLYDDSEPPIHSVAPNNASFLLRNYSLSMTPAAGTTQDTFQSLSRTSSPAINSMQVPYSKSTTPISNLASSGNLPSRRSSGTPSIDAYQQQQRLVRVRQQSYHEAIGEETIVSQEEYVALMLMRQQQRSAASMRENSASVPPAPGRLGTPINGYEAQQQYYNLYQQQQQQQQQGNFEPGSLGSMASSLRSPDYHPAATPVSTSLLATSATGSESLFFETQRRTSFDGAPGNNGGVVGASPLLSALSGGFVDESGFTARSPAPASAPAFVQRRTRSVTQPVTQSEELEELFYSNPASAAGYLLQHGAGTLQQQQQQGLYNGAGTLPLQQSGAFFLDEKEVSPTSTGGLNGFLGNGSADVGELGAYTRSGFSQHGDGVSGGRQHARALSHAGVFWADS